MEAVAAVVASTFQKGGVTFDAGGGRRLAPLGPRQVASTWDRKL